ncbi:MAG: lipopolysaccharide transport periplasmic protein LptA [Pseudomonadota bacterium]|nr:lipopolysaccharide transport periplasmic protein LptA [Pseudomonadota bacterium]
MMRPDTPRALPALLLLLLTTLSAQPLQALESDRDQPGVLDADEVDMDLQTGVRTYRGNVIYRQGSIRLDADEMVLYTNERDELDKAIATGAPAVFKQRMEGKKEDVIGKGLRIEFNQANEIVTLTDRASVSQEGNTVSGRIITYNMKTERVKVRGGARTGAGKQGAPGTIDTESTRPRLVIPPRKKVPVAPVEESGAKLKITPKKKSDS